METIEKVRIDKWLWAVRICKTRVLATKLCERGVVCVNQQRAKPSRMVIAGDAITVKRDGIEWQYVVLRCIDKRVGAKVAHECRQDCTPQAEIEKLQAIRRIPVPRRAHGMGRPTKKERRQIDKYRSYDV